MRRLTGRAGAIAVLLVAVVGCVAVAVALVGPSSGSAAPDEPTLSADSVASGALSGGGRMLVRAVDPKAPRRDGRVYELSADGVDEAGDLSCKRVHASPAGPGLCLLRAENGIDYDAVIFDADHEQRRRFPIDGVPDRARVSADGRYGAFTTFAASDAEAYFANADEFSTNTRIVDMRSGRELLRVKDLVVSEDGERIATINPQYWGVTFAGGDRYYATLGTLEHHYLIEGRIGERRARMVGEHIECPALSPDGTRIAYKRRIGATIRWRLYVLDLASGRKTPLAERRSIDDQPEWLDDDTIAYSDDKDVYAVPADGSGSPRRVAAAATSPAALGAGG
jgi:WD40 repeat protein